MLSHLDLGQCNFHGLIPTQLQNLENLVYIDLSSNRFNGRVQLFSSLVKLTALLLPNNQLTGSVAVANWTEFMQLENLDIRNNSLNGSIPASLFGMPSLRKLLLSHNRFESLENVDSHFSSSILDTLDLSSNKLQGICPTFIFKLPGIKILTLSFNNFSQALDLSFIQQLKNLSSLDLSFNNLLIEEAKEVDFSLFPLLSTLKLASCKLKKFPDFLKYQSRLNYLDLSGNEIHGEIPKWIWDISVLSHLNLSYNSLEDFENRSLTASLYVLDLASNLLHGELPSLPPSAPYMDFSRNNFSSKLPAEIGKYLSVTLFFSLASNLFKGTIPTSICNATYLQVLDLSNNSFEGHLPPCLVNMSQTLGILNLRKNRFKGHISDSFKADCMLRTFDLSWNLIRGELPKSLANCKALEVLDLGNNRIDDTFPCWLKNVSTLRVLILRSNMFHGSIGCPDTTRTWRTLQIVDLACNNFTGTLSSDCLSSWKGMMTSNNDGESTHDHLKFKVLELGQLYYQDSVTVTFKGIQMELIKIITVFSSMDFSRNRLSGKIPDIIGDFTSLFVLNFSHNMFSGHIPVSLGNLVQLESLDLSQNQLTGNIPDQLANLTFLSVLNLSYNQLEGRIPRGRQLDTFANSSYIGNKALCGAPLSNTNKCIMMPPSEKREARPSKSGGFDWQLILIGIGFGTGSATALAPVMFWEKGKTWHDKQIDMLLSRILYWLGLIQLIQDEESDQKDEQGESENASEDEVEAGEALVKHQIFCLYCSKIDITRKKVIHNTKCRCHESPPLSFTSSSASTLLYQI
uniref:Receptor-like protein 12 n=1 Tax=Kalanchoe fedtschenkoi TaxID=63787 RepID=A0A7N0RAH9_KALFE